MSNSTTNFSATGPEASILDQLATAVLCLDARLRVSYVNQAAESLFSISARKAIGLDGAQLPGLPDALYQRFIESLETGQPFSDRQVALQPLGREAELVDCLMSPLPDGAGGITLLVEISTVERSLRIAREETLIAQQEHTKSLMRGLAHEIKNPLGGLRGAAQLLESELPDPALKDYTTVIIREADRLQNLLDRILGPSNRPEVQQINVHSILEHVRKIIRAEASARVMVLTDYDPSIPEFDSDWNHLTQVFLNIAINALHAVNEGGTICFRTRVISNITLGAVRYRLAIAAQIIDDGPGVAPDMLEQIFYPMVTSRSNGSGLGLSIAQQTINQMGGLIECSSEPGKTVFTVYIPLEES